MDPRDLEGLVELAYLEAGVDPADPPPVFELIRAFLGVTVERPALMAGPPAKRFIFGGRERIAVKASVSIEYAHFYAAHELGHVLLRRAGDPDHADEAAADYLGAALMMPRAAVRAVFRESGFDPSALAEAIVCTQTAAVLRFGEVLGAPLAAVSPAAVRVRGPESWVWPDELTVRGWATRRARPGITKVRLTDQRGRVALLVDDEGAA